MSPTPAMAPKQPTRAGWALLLTSVAFFMVTLDSLVVVTALPAIHRELGGQVSTLEWAVNAYLLVFAAGIITAGAPGGSHGRLRRDSGPARHRRGRHLHGNSHDPLAVMGVVAPRDMGPASGVPNMLQRFGGVVAVAVASAVFVSNGHLGTAVSFDNGFRPALLVPAGPSVLGSVSAIMARRARAKAADRAGAGDQQERPRSEPQQPES